MPCAGVTPNNNQVLYTVLPCTVFDLTVQHALSRTAGYDLHSLNVSSRSLINTRFPTHTARNITEGSAPASARRERENWSNIWKKEAAPQKRHSRAPQSMATSRSQADLGLLNRERGGEGRGRLCRHLCATRGRSRGRGAQSPTRPIAFVFIGCHGLHGRRGRLESAPGSRSADGLLRRAARGGLERFSAFAASVDWAGK